MFWKGISLHFWQYVMFKERSSGVWTPNCGELKWRSLTLAKGRLYEKEVFVKLLRVHSKGRQGIIVDERTSY